MVLHDPAGQPLCEALEGQGGLLLHTLGNALGEACTLDSVPTADHLGPFLAANPDHALWGLLCFVNGAQQHP